MLSLGSYATPLLAFIAVLVMIPFALWLLKRTPVGAASSSAGMRTISALPLGAQQRLLTVEVGSGADRRWLVLGVTPSNIATLWTMEPQAEVPGAAPTPTAQFSQLLSRLTSRDGGSHGR
jgi:flagellar protein FliO/FliZ